jgi:hypothetical protein
MEQRQAIVEANIVASANLSPAEQRAVRERGMQALWYAWGQLDSGALSSRDLDHGWLFATQVEAEAIAYETQVTYFMRSILGAWGEYVADAGITRL